MFQRNPENRTLWIGDIEPWMNEKTIEDIFNQFGKQYIIYDFTSQSLEFVLLAHYPYTPV